eukprot:TRINITY_DN74661_c0_g1_i1.p1 TRINITY_DN74661_c0_g1~~TRINITY_DN74661_c0_g1_i1.p1  ORF type:complete len:811 (-),score=138.77 TRINITY_DN74661_c0_g1_i1:66-2498(-)
MPNDGSECFNEQQLYGNDVAAEDPELAQLATAAAASPAGSVEASSLGSLLPPLSDSRDAGPTLKTGRKKKGSGRSAQIAYWLETKYDVLGQVCASFPQWREAASVTSDFDLLWSDTAISADRFMKLKTYQKFNHFVGMSSITRKNNLGRNLLRMRKQFPEEYNFFPDTWILPTDLSDFKSQFSAARNKTFIIKPDNGCQGKGIYLVRDVDKVPVDFSTTYVAQRYIHKPFLLDDHKFDLRLYALVMGCDPLRIFLHKRGLVRLAAETYVEPTGKNLSQQSVHLTNYAINKDNPNFEENTNPDDAKDGHKRSWEAVLKRLAEEGHDVQKLQERIDDLIVKTLLAVQPSLSHFYHSCQPDDLDNAMCFEILGFDIMLDQKLQPWLLEVNHAPSFATESELDKVVKEDVLRDTLVLLDLRPEKRLEKKREAREKMESYQNGAAGEKVSAAEKMAKVQEIALQRTQWEDANCGGYRRLYPTEETERRYLQIHEAALGIWEMLMGGTSRRPVRLTQLDDEQTANGGPGKSTNRKATAAGERVAAEPVKRTKEEIQELVDRLFKDHGAARSKRRGSMPPGVQADSNSEQSARLDGVVYSNLAAEVASSQTDEAAPAGKRKHTLSTVSVGDVLRVQTNLGWEPATVITKLPNGRVDIIFKDGEAMYSVLPRVQRDAQGLPTIIESGKASGKNPEAPTDRSSAATSGSMPSVSHPAFRQQSGMCASPANPVASLQGKANAGHAGPKRASAGQGCVPVFTNGGLQLPPEVWLGPPPVLGCAPQARQGLPQATRSSTQPARPITYVSILHTCASGKSRVK